MSTTELHPYHTSFNLPRCLFIGIQMTPYFLNHFIRQPHRRSIRDIDFQQSPADLQQRIRSTLYDAMFDLLFTSYTEITGERLRQPTTGQAMYFLRSAVTCFDDAFERRYIAGQRLDLNEMFLEPEVANKISVVLRYTEIYHKSSDLKSYIQQMCSEYYDAYSRIFRKAASALRYDDVHHVAEIDSGVGVRLLMEFASVFNSHPISQEASDTFFAYGMVAKFADDMVDIVRDIREGNLNLLHAMITDESDEYQLLQAAIQDRKSLHMSWWRQQCPRTFARYFDAIETYYRQLHAPTLRLASDLVLLPIVVGYDFDAARFK